MVLATFDDAESVEALLTVRNAQDSALTLERIETSCPCIGVAPTPICIGAHEVRTLTVSLDASSDPDFEGTLGVELTGFLRGGRVGFRTKVMVDRGHRIH